MNDKRMGQGDKCFSIPFPGHFSGHFRQFENTPFYYKSQSTYLNLSLSLDSYFIHFAVNNLPTKSHFWSGHHLNAVWNMWEKHYFYWLFWTVSFVVPNKIESHKINFEKPVISFLSVGNIDFGINLSPRTLSQASSSVSQSGDRLNNKIDSVYQTCSRRPSISIAKIQCIKKSR